MADQKFVRRLLVLEKETENTIRFEELDQPGLLTAVGRLYVRKNVLKLVGNPKLVEMVLTPADKEVR